MFPFYINSLKREINPPILTSFSRTDLAVQWHDTCLTDLVICSISLEVAAKKFHLLFVSLSQSHFPNQACRAGS